MRIYEYMRMLRIKNESGVSLIELVVAVTLFSIVMLAATQIFKMVVDGQRNAISAQNVQENMRYALEKMSKEIRMAKISNTVLNQECVTIFSLPAATYKVFNTIGSDKIYFKNKDDNCVVYYLDNNRLKTTISDGITIIDDFVTPSKISVSNLNFYVVDDFIGAFHSTQPYVTMVMDVKAIGLAINDQKMKIQITVSSRYYE